MQSGGGAQQGSGHGRSAAASPSSSSSAVSTPQLGLDQQHQQQQQQRQVGALLHVCGVSVVPSNLSFHFDDWFGWDEGGFYEIVIILISVV